LSLRWQVCGVFSSPIFWQNGALPFRIIFPVGHRYVTCKYPTEVCILYYSGILCWLCAFLLPLCIYLQTHPFSRRSGICLFTSWPRCVWAIRMWTDLKVSWVHHNRQR
jgi:hypothetical protein